MDRDEAVRKLTEAKVGRIATVRPDGSPHVVPFVFVVIDADDGLRLYWCVDDKPKRSRGLQRLVNVRANPAVELEVDRYDDDWSELWWVRASGMAREVTSPDERARALTALAAKYPPYAGHPPSGPVVAIQVDRVSWWAAGASRTELS
ncbi:MAG: TIGR03668 family PPOX class F420-dependent oxidoreductase [Actinobacteria bacterium]|nr:MAG: TIGR03668 family PPOX class F420-dependent oxidoreductase [Actinomycetota bacterium]TMK22987.1 MAG: TIGR03668 family PPOX class F420-dependent oxidoreductase [Actinomycetota bacterium]TMK94081.1 MAG: TIGR03668 family PPOX class F420-dependent oxidoreductase [Actinomycetota bacterium]TMM25296.1 MAG: TIGR03668 family PPOX class F420-dependent oxidoreductase [Actinomycetota bacterium]